MTLIASRSRWIFMMLAINGHQHIAIVVFNRG
jgi:hypothetical protein